MLHLLPDALSSFPHESVYPFAFLSCSAVFLFLFFIENVLVPTVLGAMGGGSVHTAMNLAADRQEDDFYELNAQLAGKVPLPLRLCSLLCALIMLRCLSILYVASYL